MPPRNAHANGRNEHGPRKRTAPADRLTKIEQRHTMAEPSQGDESNADEEHQSLQAVSLGRPPFTRIRTSHAREIDGVDGHEDERDEPRRKSRQSKSVDQSHEVDQELRGKWGECFNEGPELTEVDDSWPEYERYHSQSEVPVSRTSADRLGAGHEGEVDEVKFKDRSNSAIMARKIIRWGKEEEMQGGVLGEIRAMQRCSGHRHVVQLVLFYLLFDIEVDAFNIVMKPRANCNLETLLLNKGGKHGIGDTHRALVLRKAPGCLSQALQFIHKQGVYHADLCCQNMLVHEINILIADFGISRLRANNEAKTLGIGLDGWAVKEDFAKDLSGLGKIFLSIATAVSSGHLTYLDVRFLKSFTTARDCYPLMRYFWFLRHKNPDSEDENFASALAEISFLIMPGKRITADQLVNFIAKQDAKYRTIRTESCEECRSGWREAKTSSEHPFAIFKSTWEMGAELRLEDFKSSEKAFEEADPFSWDDMKRRLLKNHLHGLDDKTEEMEGPEGRAAGQASWR